MKLPIGQLCVVFWTDNELLRHLIGHYCEVISHDPCDEREYVVLVRTDGMTYWANRHHLLPINPDAPVGDIEVQEVEEVTA
jgi:hypothetical protein